MQSLPDGPIIAGAVTYAGSRTGRVYLTVASCSGCSAIAGTSLAAPGAFSIRGDDQNNTGTTLFAFMDTLGSGHFNAAADPSGAVTFDFQGSTVDVGSFALTDPTPQTPPQVAIQEVATSSDSALVIWSTATDSLTRAEIADHYNVYAAEAVGGTCPTSFGSPAVVSDASALSAAMVTLSPGASFCFAVAAVNNGTEGPLSATSGPWTIQEPTGGHTVTGTVTFPIPNVPLVVALASPNGAHIYFQRIGAPNSPQGFAINGVPDGTYSVGAFLDGVGNGHIDPRDPSNGLLVGAAPRLTVTSNTSINLSIGSANGRNRVVTQRSSGGFALGFDLQPNLRLPVAASILSGPNLATVIDLPLGENGVGLGARRGLGLVAPQVGDAYAIHVEYLGGFTEDIFPAVTGVITTAPTQDALDPFQLLRPNFTWALPDAVPGSYYEELSVETNQGDRLWDTELPAGTVEATYDFDGSARAAVLDTGTAYDWRVRIVDADGNSAESGQTFTTPDSLSATGGFFGQVSYAGSSTGRIYITAAACPNCQGIGTSLAAPGSFDMYGYTQSPNGQVFAFMDVLGTGAYNAASDPAASFAFSNGGSGNVNVGTLVLQDPVAPSPGTASVQIAIPAEDSALVFAAISGSADHVALYAAQAAGNTCPASLGQPVQTAIAQSELPALLTGLTPGAAYCFAAAAVVEGTTGTISSAFGPVTIQAPSGANTVSGTVTFPATPGAALVVVAVPPDGSGGGLYYTRIENPVSPQAYSIAGVAAGSYQVGAFLDTRGPGHIDPRDPSNGLFDGSAAVVDVSGDLTRDLVISSDASVASAIIGAFDFGFGPSYQLELEVRANFKVPVNAELLYGPGLASFGDIGTNNQQLGSSFPLSSAPGVGDQYLLNVEYDDGSTENLVAPVTGVVGAFATLLAPAANSIDQSTTPSFAWSLPAQLPTPYRQRIFVAPTAGGDWLWREDLAAGVTSADYDEDGSASQPALSPGISYGWGVQLTDASGNFAQIQRTFTTQ